jgi:hypothetical protein
MSKEAKDNPQEWKLCNAIAKLPILPSLGNGRNVSKLIHAMNNSDLRNAVSEVDGHKARTE